jgi:cobalt/nickel transport system permease protein
MRQGYRPSYVFEVHHIGTGGVPAMHMADALLSPAIGGAMWAVTGTAIAVASRTMTRSMDHKWVPLMGVMGAFVFAAQMINFTIPGTGSSGHFTGGVLLSMLLGPSAAFLTMASVLIVQALFFADGGLLALGANIFNMGFVACFVVYPLLLAPFAGPDASPFQRRAAILFGAIISLVLGASGVVLETTVSGISELPFSTFVLAMLPIHLAIGAVEGLITLAVLEFVWKAEPEIAARTRAQGGAISRGTLAALAVLAMLTAGGLSWFASKNPDGLEWSITQLTGKGELESKADSIHATAARIQSQTAILPDYDFASGEKKEGKGEGAEPAWGAPNVGTSVSGLVGGGLTLLIAGLAGWLFRRRQPAAGTSPV